MALITRRTYRHVRHAYQAVANRPFAREQRRFAELLRQFVHRGDLVFDIGANRGNYTDVLLTLGARVVAVEPNPSLAGLISRHYPVAVVQAAVGATPASLPLHLGVDPGHSTLSADWVDQAPARASGKTVLVEVVTLSQLAERYGRPAFIKIDVEGYEYEVLRGSDAFPPALSFEYQCANLTVAEQCIELLEGYEFNSVPLTETAMAGEWCDPAALLARLTGYEAEWSYGDVYARRR